MKRFIILSAIFLGLLGCAESKQNNIERVMPGIYNMESIKSFIGTKTIAVVANQASKIDGTHLIDTLLSIGVEIKAIFSPEHGFSGNYDAGSHVKNERWIDNSIQIISLYGENKKPLIKDLEGVDLIVFDLQDVGTRFYTYISTLHYVMEAAAEIKIPLLVLDRPNPNANKVDGPVLIDKYRSFVGMHKVPVLYGMTIGEYATMINGEEWLSGGLKSNLRVIKNENYTHDSAYELPFKPSPNLPNMRSIYLYPSLCFFEGTIISVGRGTNFPFQVYGHPEFREEQFSFTPLSIPGVCVKPKYMDKECFGVSLKGLNVDSLRLSEEIKLDYILHAYRIMNNGDKFFNNYFEYLVGNDTLRNQIENNFSAEEIRKSWQKDLENFKKIRAKYLLYP